jgi:asparagine synthase (glutamine-hydrolysing)
MSVQFGRWNFGGRPAVAPGYIEKVQTALSPYGPDGTSSYSKAGVNILYGAFHTTKESQREAQPHISQSGAVITWDGRLDNRAELIHQFRDTLASEAPDILIVAVAYERWGTNCFAKLIGDWAVSIWQAGERSLILAKDPIGIRHLYYSLEDDHVTWSTILDPLVLFAGRSFSLEEEYIAGWLSFFPAVHLTPYVGIQSVPPSCFVRVEKRRQTVTKYWDFEPTRRIRYHTDAEYEEHFRVVFTESVRRRLRSDSPTLAELSGGMDSSSIVCVADRAISSGLVGTPRLDTVSYYDDSEPSWNERPFFSKVEAWRGRAGRHIDVSSQEAFQFELEDRGFIPTPACGSRPTEASKQFTIHVMSQGYRVLLCGTAGDEVTGGVPTPIPELANLLASGRLRMLTDRLKAWSLNKRKPWIHLLFETVRCFLPPGVFATPAHKAPAPWLSPNFIKRYQASFAGYETRLKLFGPLPSSQENLNTIDALRRQLACAEPISQPAYEKYYPYLDRDLLEFLFAVPREQLVRPGQRRSLTRRALVGIVPNEILNRKRKAFVARRPIIALFAARPGLIETAQNMISSSFGFIRTDLFLKALQNTHDVHEIPVGLLLRTAALESWLKAFVGSNSCCRDHPVSSHRPMGDRRASSIFLGKAPLQSHEPCTADPPTLSGHGFSN